MTDAAALQRCVCEVSKIRLHLRCHNLDTSVVPRTPHAQDSAAKSAGGISNPFQSG
jgi:hypothetical protein